MTKRAYLVEFCAVGVLGLIGEYFRMPSLVVCSIVTLVGCTLTRELTK
jgi:hypothetical protein